MRWAAAEAQLRAAPLKILTAYLWNGSPEAFGGVGGLPDALTKWFEDMAAAAASRQRDGARAAPERCRLSFDAMKAVARDRQLRSAIVSIADPVSTPQASPWLREGLRGRTTSTRPRSAGDTGLMRRTETEPNCIGNLPRRDHHAFNSTTRFAVGGRGWPPAGCPVERGER